MGELHTGHLVNGRYRIGTKLTVGGSGVVYKAQDTHLYDRPVAVKILLNPVRRKMYLLEIEVLAKLQNAGVAAPYDWGVTESGNLFTVWELINGSSLGELIRLTGAMAFPRAARFIQQIGEALTAIHDAGICHLDVSPWCILIRDPDKVTASAVIVDFGMARLETDLRETFDGKPIGGSTAYGAPELFSGQRASALSDIYSFGCVAHEILTGHPPVACLDRLTSGASPNPISLRPDLPVAASLALLKALSLRPEDRYAQAKEFGDGLAHALKLGSFCTGSPPRPLSVFLCHSSSDKPAVRDLWRCLLAEGIDAWLDEEKLLPGQDWQLEIASAVRRSDVVVACLSRTSITKEGFVQKEIKWALDVADEKPEGTIFVIPARLEECDVPRRLSGLQWVDIFNQRGTQALLEALRSRAREIGLKS